MQAVIHVALYCLAGLVLWVFLQRLRASGLRVFRQGTAKELNTAVHTRHRLIMERVRAVLQQLNERAAQQVWLKDGQPLQPRVCNSV